VNTLLSRDMEVIMEKRKLSPDQKCTLLIQFVEREERVPTSKEVVDGVKLGSFWKNIKQKGIGHKLYDKYLRANTLLSRDMEKFCKRFE
jgi:hypothetical protein